MHRSSSEEVDLEGDKLTTSSASLSLRVRRAILGELLIVEAPDTAEAEDLARFGVVGLGKDDLTCATRDSRDRI